MPDSNPPSRFDYGRGVAGAAVLVLAIVTVAAFFSGMPGDRPGAAVFAPIVILAAIAAVRTRAATEGASRWLVALGLAQIAGGAVLVAREVGTPEVVLELTGLFTVAWLGAAWLLRANAPSAEPHA